MDKIIHSFLNEQTSCLKEIQKDTKILEKIIEILISARDKKKRIFVMGNGGSGSTASHLVSDLLKTAITKGDNRFSAISLVDNIPVILAWANDSNYDDIFSEQVKNHVSEGDVLIGFSGSGKSQNILNAFSIGKKNDATCIGITGMGGGDFPKICDVSFIVPHNDMLTIESTHLVLCHCIVSTIRNKGKPLFTYD
jgi:D-sedoheptulose 7-phosphate isomerase|tara:strand:+ start:105 stop:689 length:585 start_codon:yes stop_codon:yes gene_type:complete